MSALKPLRACDYGLWPTRGSWICVICTPIKELLEVGKHRICPSLLLSGWCQLCPVLPSYRYSPHVIYLQNRTFCKRARQDSNLRSAD